MAQAPNQELKKKILALEAGADDAAIVELECPEITDQRADILEIFPRTKSLVSLVCKMNRKNIHNYRDRLGGFQDWVERVVSSRDVANYRRKVSDPETTSIWQSLSYGICNKSSYCLAVCPAGEEVIGPFLDDRQTYLDEVVKPFQNKEESIYVVPASDAEQYVARRFPHKKIRLIGNGLRAGSARSFLESLPLIFQRGQSEGLNATYHFTFTGAEALTGTAVIKDQQISVLPGLVGKADLHLTADSRTWVDFLAREKGLLPALIQRKIRIKGSPRLMKQFARCFPS